MRATIMSKGGETMRKSSRFFAAAFVAVVVTTALCGAVEEKPAARAGKLDVTYYFLPG